MPVYTTSKAAVQGLTRSLARDFGPFNIRVNTLVPGWVMTEKQVRLWGDNEHRQEIARGQCIDRPLTSTSRAWPCSSPPTTAPCAPRRTSSSTAAGPEPMSDGTASLFGYLPDGRAVHEHTLNNGRGLVLRAIDFGGIVTALHCPDRAGRSANVVLGFDTLADYVERIRTSAPSSAATATASRAAASRSTEKPTRWPWTSTRCTAGRAASASAGGRSSACRHRPMVASPSGSA